MTSKPLQKRTSSQAIYFSALIAASLLFGGLGYFMPRTSSLVSKINVTLPPDRPADRNIEVDLWGNHTSFIQRQDRVALINEKNPNPSRFLKFYCPRGPYESSTLILRFQLDKATQCEHAFLTLSSAASFNFDPTAKIQIALASESTNGNFVEIAELSAKTQENVISEPFDVSDYARHSSFLEVRLKASATKLLYHPTPNDPIGFAGSQLLRQARNDKFAAKLAIWFTDPGQNQL